MKKIYLLLLVLHTFLINSLKAQTWTSNPAASSGLYTPCGNSGTQPCSFGNVFGNNVIKAKVNSLNSTSVTIEIKKCTGTFDTSGVAYIKSSICNTNAYTNANYAKHSSTVTLTFNHGVSFGQTITFYPTITSHQAGNRFYSEPITITGPTCTAPVSSTFSYTNVTTNSFTANWGSVTGATSYDLNYTLYSDNTYSNATTISNISGTSYNISNLNCGASYRFQVRAKCGSTTYSVWSGSYGSPVNLQTCNIPNENSFWASNITSNGFRANWNAIAGASSYDIDITNCSNSSYPGNYINTTNTYYTFNGLNSSTSYKFQVRAKCANNCNSNFSGSIPSCVATLAPASPNLYIHTALSITPNTYTQSQTGSRSVTIGNSGNAAWTGDIALRLTNVGDGSWVDADYFSNVTIPANGSYYFSGTSNKITSAPGNYKLEVYKKPAGGNFSFGIGNGDTKNFSIVDPFNEVGFFVTDITSSSAKIHWKHNNGVDKNIIVKYDVNVAQCSSNYPGTPTVTNITDTFCIIANLITNTTYKFQVRPVFYNDANTQLIQGSFSGSISDANGNIACFSTASPAQLCTYSPISITPSSGFIQTQSATRSLTVKNNGGSVWSGSLVMRMTPYTPSIPAYDDIIVANNLNIPAGGTQTISGSSNKIKSKVGDYRLDIWRQENGNWIPGLGCGPYDDTLKIKIVDPFAPTTFFPSDISTNSVKVHWSFKSGVDKSKMIGYHVNLAECSDTYYSNAIFKDGITDTFTTFSGLIPSTSYKYQLRGVFYNDQNQLDTTDWSGSISSGTNINCFSTLAPASYSLVASTPNVSPLPLVQGQTPTSFSNTITNIGNAPFNGYLFLSWHDASGNYITDLNSNFNTIQNIPYTGNNSITISKSTGPILSAPGTYQIITKYSTYLNGPYTYLNTTTVTVQAPNTCLGCTSWTNPPQLGTIACTATSFLCSNAYIVQSQDGAYNNTTDMLRRDLATMIYNVIFNNSAAPSDYFPTLYLDLTDKTAYYYKPALALSHLAYGDAETPFKYDADFNPDLPIARKFALKVFLEAWNIPPDNTGFDENDSSPSTFACDVFKNHEMYGYLQRAKSLGIINGYSAPYCNCSGPNLCLNPDGNITREEAFIIMYNLFQLSSYPKPVVDFLDFHTPHDITIETIREKIGKAKGGFNEYGETAFALNGHVPLHFNFHYDAAKTGPEYQEFFYKSTKTGERYNFESMGRGWTHNYNSYIIIKKGIDNSSFNDDFIIVRYTDGEYAIFKFTSATTFEPVSKGTYESLTLVGNEYHLKFKYQIVFKYKTVGSIQSRAMLSSITDRFSNQISLTWDTVSNNAFKSYPRLKEVQDPYGRKLTFEYNIPFRYYLISKVNCITPSITRSASFNYNAYFELITYSNAKQQNTQYGYSNEEKKKHLLNKVTKPKGNNLYCDYDNNRKLTRTSLTPMLNINDGDEFIQTMPSYQASGSSTTVVTGLKPTSGTTQAHITTNVYNSKGNLQSSVATNGSTDIVMEYNDTQNPTLPTKITNNKTGIVSQFSYDISNTHKRGNLLTTSLTSSLGTKNTSTTYNNLNDPETHTDVGNVQTINTWTNGALTGIARNGINTIIIPNSNGTVAQISHGGVSTTFGYNAYGNRSSVSIAGTNISSSAIFDDASRLIQITHPNGRIDKVTQYDDLDNALQIIEDFGVSNITTTQVFDANNNQTHFTKEGQTTTWDFDATTDDLVKETFGPYFNQWYYNLDHTLQWFKNKNGVQFTLNYHPMNGPKEGLVLSDGYANYDYYTNTLNLHTISKDGKTITLNYDAWQQPTSANYNDNIPGNTIGHSYNNYGSIITTNYRNSNVVEHTRNANNQIVETKWNGVVIHKRNYDATSGREVSQEFGQGLFTKTNTYHPNTAQLTAIDYHNTSNQALYYEHFTQLDNSGNHTQVDIMPLSVLAPPQPFADTLLFPPDALNRVTQDTNGSNTAYNQNGVQTGGAITTTADERDNILTLTKGIYTATMEYDGLEVRRKKNNTLYVVDVLDGNKVLEETDLNGNSLWINIWSGPEIVCRINAQTNEKYYPISSYNGSVRMWMNSAGTITHAYYYDADGNVMDKMEAFTQPYQYVGIYGVQTDAPDIVYMQARYYRPSQRRYISADPIYASNQYAYAGNNPVINVDPGGEAAETILDAASIAFSIYELAKDPSLVNAGFLAWDIAATALPFVPGSYVAKAGKLASKSDNVTTFYRGIRDESNYIGRTDQILVNRAKQHYRKGTLDNGSITKVGEVKNASQLHKKQIEQGLIHYERKVEGKIANKRNEIRMNDINNPFNLGLEGILGIPGPLNQRIFIPPFNPVSW